MCLYSTGKQSIYVFVTHLCLTLCKPMAYSLPGSSVHVILQARILEWVAISFSRGSSQSRDWTQVSHTAGRFFTICWSLSHAQLFVTPRTTTRQTSLSFTISWSLLKLMSIESVMPSNNFVLCRPLLLPSNLSQHQVLFSWVSSSHQAVKVLKLQLQHQSFQWLFRNDFL